MLQNSGDEVRRSAHRCVRARRAIAAVLRCKTTRPTSVGIRRVCARSNSMRWGWGKGCERPDGLCRPARIQVAGQAAGRAGSLSGHVARAAQAQSIKQKQSNNIVEEASAEQQASDSPVSKAQRKQQGRQEQVVRMFAFQATVAAETVAAQSRGKALGATKVGPAASPAGKTAGTSVSNA